MVVDGNGCIFFFVRQRIQFIFCYSFLIHLRIRVAFQLSLFGNLLFILSYILVCVCILPLFWLLLGKVWFWSLKTVRSWIVFCLIHSFARTVIAVATYLSSKRLFFCFVCTIHSQNERRRRNLNSIYTTRTRKKGTFHCILNHFLCICLLDFLFCFCFASSFFESVTRAISVRVSICMCVMLA